VGRRPPSSVGAAWMTTNTGLGTNRLITSLMAMSFYKTGKFFFWFLGLIIDFFI
jgi:hypothetical protein